MLKTSVMTPFLSPFPPKTRLLKPYTTISKSLPPTVRQNAPLTPPTPTPTLSPPTSAYIHLPFCRKRCHYCDFPILALGTSPSLPHHDPRISDYTSLLLQEISSATLSPQNPPLQTLFFGGGTPSLVPAPLVENIISSIRGKFGLHPSPEISIEMDPGTFNSNKLNDFINLGINRVSLGVQAFQDELLNACGRAHGVREVEEAIEMVRESGVGNWSMDLMSSLPHQTGEMWEESLRRAVEAGPTHVSVYDLQVEKGTKFGLMYTPGESPLPSETQAADFYRMASEILTKAGYEHYEISSYCKSGFECKHNVTYWNNKPFYGFGLGSASYLNGKRFSRPKKLKEYTSYVHNLENKSVERDENNCIDIKDNGMDTVMLSLRTAKGLDMKIFREIFGSSVVHLLFKAYKPYVESGHVIFLDENRRALNMDDFCSMFSDEGKRENIVAFIRLSDPDGFLLSNELIATAFRVIAP